MAVLVEAFTVADGEEGEDNQEGDVEAAQPSTNTEAKSAGASSGGKRRRGRPSKAETEAKLASMTPEERWRHDVSAVLKKLTRLLDNPPSND